MKTDELRATGSFGAHLKALRDAAGFTQEELATIAGLSVHAVSALERGERRRPHVETVRSLSAALDLTGDMRDAFLASARGLVQTTTAHASFPLPLTSPVGRDGEMLTLQRWLSDPTTRVVTMIGAGGVGKARRGLELAGTLGTGGPTGVVFVALATIGEAQSVAFAIAEALGLANLTAADRRGSPGLRDALDERAGATLQDSSVHEFEHR